MFSKALFKQSCKANGTMWAIITFAVCFMLACVMLISGSGSLGETKDAIQDTIIQKEIDSSLETRAIHYYVNAKSGMQYFDAALVKELPTAQGNTAQEKVAYAYQKAFDSLKNHLVEEALKLDPSYTTESKEVQEIVGSVVYVINPQGAFNDFYTSHGEEIPADYDVTSIWIAYAGILGTKSDVAAANAYISGDTRLSYVEDRAKSGSSIFLAGNMVDPANVESILAELKKYNVTPEKYASFGYDDYATLKRTADTTIVTFEARWNYEMDLLKDQLDAGEISQDEYNEMLVKVQANLEKEIAGSLLTLLPAEVSEALEEIGKADLYTLVVGSIFYKLAGLLLPIIYMIMASNNLIAGQVDSGSMAYVLSTSTKRKTVVFTQAVYLIGSLLAMFMLTTATGCVCLSIVKADVELTYGKLLLLNLGAFLVLFALSGLCFLTSCWFDRSKRSMAIGGGLSIFALVAAMLGLFGSKVIPSVVRLDALNNFNYTTIISLFDVISIMEGNLTYLWKFAILIVLGVAGYIVGSVKFDKKDLPL